MQAIYAGADYRGHDLHAFTQGQQLICSKAQQVLTGWRGMATVLSDLAHMVTHPATGTLIHPWTIRNHELAQAVRAGDSFSDWGVLLQHRNSACWFCTACPQVHSCRHAAAASLDSQPPVAQWLSEQAFEDKLRAVFDVDTGEKHVEW